MALGRFGVGVGGGGEFSSPEPVVSWSRVRETRGRLQIKPSGAGDENGICTAWAASFQTDIFANYI